MSVVFVDTQVISYGFKGQAPVNLRKSHISSVAASEFLRVYDDTLTQARYYVPVNRFSYTMDGAVRRLLMPRREHPFGKMATDQVLLNYGPPFPPVMEFGSLAVSRTINEKLWEEFVAATDFLDKAQRKLVRARWRFLVDHEIQCVPLNPRVTELTGILLHDFVSQFEPKRKFRNTLNDVIILASAKSAGATLVTRDSLLARFAGSTRQLAPPFVEVKFETVTGDSQRPTKESKGFVNRGWDIKFRRWGNEIA